MHAPPPTPRRTGNPIAGPGLRAGRNPIYKHKMELQRGGARPSEEGHALARVEGKSGGLDSHLGALRLGGSTSARAAPPAPISSFHAARRPSSLASQGVAGRRRPRAAAGNKRDARLVLLPVVVRRRRGRLARLGLGLPHRARAAAAPPRSAPAAAAFFSGFLSSCVRERPRRARGVAVGRRETAAARSRGTRRRAPSPRRRAAS